MDSYPQPPNRYMPPPPPPNPHFPHQQQPPPSQRPPPPPPFPPQGPSWYSSGQFQYHPSPSPSHSHSPSPPPPQPWGHHHLPPPPGAPQPHPDHFSPYPPPPPHQQGQYPPFPPPQPSHSPQMAPPPHSHAQAYPGGNQDWGNANWHSHAGWNNPAHGNEEDWAARAKAWADANRSAMENQSPSLQSQYPGHYPLSAEPHFQNNPQTSVPMSQPNYENYPAPIGASMTNQTPLVHYPEPSVGSSGNSFRSQEGSFLYGAKDGNFHDAGVAHLQQEGLATQSINKQEVPSSYSSAPGKQDAKKEQLFTTSAMVNSAATDQTPFQYVGQSAYGYTDPHDQPLEFTPRFSHESNLKLQPGYAEPAGPVGGMDAVTALPSYQSWMPPVASNSSFPTILPTYPSATQQDPTIGVPPLAVQHSPMLGGIPGPNSNFPPVPSVTTPIGLGGGSAIHPSAFPGDLYGMGAERPKKAAVPDWLRDEIIKKRDVITSSLDHANDENQSFEDEPIDKSVGKSIQADIRSVESSRSTEEEEDDEDEVAAARTAAINLEIKRILTEVLLKVTTDLFDEIATRVLSEDDLPVEAGQDTHDPAQKLSSPVTVSTAKASAKVLIPVKSKEYRAEDASEKASSGAAGNLLGLANYSSSSDEEDNEIRSSTITKPEGTANTSFSSIKQLVEENHCKIENGHTSLRTEEGSMNKDHTVASSSGLQDNHGAHVGLSSTKVGKDLDNENVGHLRSSRPIEKKDHIIANDKNVMDSSYTSMGDGTGIKATDVRLEGPSEGARRRSKDVEVEGPGRENREESQRSSSRRTSSKELDSLKKYEKGDETHGRRERSRDLGHEDKAKGLDSGKHSSHRGSKESKREIEGSNRVIDKDSTRRKKEPSRDENDYKHRHKRASDISRSKRRRSSSISSRDRNSKDKSLVGQSDDSSDEASGDSRRKVHMKRRNLSPSPDRSHGRQVSRSPPSSKVSQRRHSPYSSLGSSRRRRSRSRSPARRRR